MAAASDIEFNIVAHDNATEVMRRIRREATRTQFAVMHQRLLIALWTVLLILFGAALGVGLTVALT